MTTSAAPVLSIVIPLLNEEEVLEQTYSVLTKQLYPDQDSFKKEEQRRFEILEAHWDLPIKEVDLEAR